MQALISMLRKRLYITWLGWAVAGVALAAVPITNLLTLQSAMGRMRFVTMDTRDTFYLTSAGSFEETKQLRLEIAKLATETIFSRSPEDFNDTERLERLFNPATTARLKQEASRDADIFRVQQIHQSCETGKILELQVDENTALVSVETQVLRTGSFNGRIINTSHHLVVFLRMTVNDSMAHNGRYPLVITDYQEKF
jgi:hypothetical protein